MDAGVPRRGDEAGDADGEAPRRLRRLSDALHGALGAGVAWWYRGGRPDAAARAARARAGRERGTDPAAYWRMRHTGNVNPRGDLLGIYLDAARRAGLKVGGTSPPPTAPSCRTPGTGPGWRRSRPGTTRGVPLSVEEQSTYDDRDRSPAGHGRYGSGSTRAERTIPTLVPGDDRAAAVRSGRLPASG
ncbi:hypothetical protein GCM10023082_60410 [Streptomyces tremellae]|uniref:Uncharacterized protein n=1 Tax=Streptomyces tremellae TaxID=1124239 RepID=A0ABP7GAT1_9ACTN